MEKKNKSKLSTVLSIITVAFLIVYIGWRILCTLPDYEVYGWVAFVAGIALVIAEAISVMEALIQCWDLNNQYVPKMPEIPEEWYPDVDVMIATHNEEEELLFKTVNACTRMKYPDKSKVHIHICDDTNRPEIKKLAEELNVNYFGLSDNKLAKAGNLNNAIGKTSAPLIVTFDADMIPNSDFLMETVPYFFLPRMKEDENGKWVERTEDEIDKNYKIGFIQTPQSFYNPDLFQYNLYCEDNIPNEQDYFFRQINLGKNRSNSPIYAGSNTVISREALELVGGIRTGTITEDFETGLMIESNGYSCYAIDKLLAKGLAPITIKSLIKQRERWARGCIFSLRRIHILTNPDFDWKLKLSYFACRLYWGSFTRRLIYIVAPVFFVMFDIPVVVCSLKEIMFIWLPSYILYAITLKKISGDIRNTRWSNIIDTTIFPYMLLPIWAESLFIQKKDFHVTSKARVQEDNSIYMAIPHLFLLCFCVLATIFMVKDLVVYKAFGSIVVIYWLLVNSFSLLMSIFFMMGRKSERMAERFYVNLPVTITYEDKEYEGNIVDISEGGFAMVLDSAIYLPYKEGTHARCIIDGGEYTASVEARIVTVRKETKMGRWKYCMSITEMDEANKKEYLQIIYDREHTLPKTLSDGSTYFGDIIKNISRRNEGVHTSKRQVVRIEVDEVCQLSDGSEVLLENYNFEYARISVSDGKQLPKELTLYEGTEYEMHCKIYDEKTKIFAITNWEELMENETFMTKVDSWNNKSKKKKSRGKV